MTRPTWFLSLSLLLLLQGGIAAREGAAFGDTPAITATGTAREVQTPDRARISVQVEAGAATGEGATRDLAAKVNRVLAVLTAAGIGEADTESDGPTVQALFETVRNERGGETTEKLRRTGYKAEYGLVVVVPQIETIPALLPRIADAGGLVRSVDFALKDGEARLLALEERAVKDAVERAHRLIVAAGARPGRILAIVPQGEEGGLARRAMRSVSARPAAPAEAEIRIPVRPGRITLDTRVTVSVEIVAP